jgi:hypothetical protein
MSASGQGKAELADSRPFTVALLLPHFRAGRVEGVALRLREGSTGAALLRRSFLRHERANCWIAF